MLAEDDNFSRLRHTFPVQLVGKDQHPILCTRCFERMALPLKGRCAHCEEQHHALQDEQIKQRMVHGFEERCAGCHSSTKELWIVGFDAYHFIETQPGRFIVCCKGMYHVFCHACAASSLHTPASEGRGRWRWLMWRRNLRFVRKIKSLGPVAMEVCQLLAQNDF